MSLSPYLIIGLLTIGFGAGMLVGACVMAWLVLREMKDDDVATKMSYIPVSLAQYKRRRSIRG